MINEINQSEYALPQCTIFLPEGGGARGAPLSMLVPGNRTTSLKARNSSLLDRQPRALRTRDTADTCKLSISRVIGQGVRGDE